MRIGLNLLPFQKTMSGTTIYALNISEQLLQLNKKHEFIFFVNQQSEKIFGLKNSNAKIIRLPFDPNSRSVRIFWEQMILPFFLKKQKIDLLFSPSVVLPVFSGCKNVICIHDLIPFNLKDKYSGVRTLYVKNMTKLSAKKADYIFTVSNNSKEEIQKYLAVPSSKIGVSYNAVNERIFSFDLNEWERFKQKNKIPEKYILFVGTLEPGKNLVRLIRAFKLLVERDRVDHKLIIAGKKGWLFDNIFSETKKLKLVDKIIFPGYVEDNVLGLLYKNADVFVLPSLYEGFGIPALEAMAFGVPVVASKVSSLPEVVGEAGLLVDPKNEQQIAATIKQVILDKSLKSELVRKGYTQAKKFSWEKSAQLILSIFEEIAAID